MRSTERILTVSVVFHSHGFYDVPWVFIVDARSFHALAAIVDYVTHLASMLCWYRPDARQDEFRILKLLSCEFRKYEVMTISVVGGQQKKKHLQIPVIEQQIISNAPF